MSISHAIHPHQPDTCRRFRLATLVTCRAAVFALPAQAEALDTSIGRLEFEAGLPASETIQKRYDELDVQRAVQAYLWALCRWRRTAPWQTPTRRWVQTTTRWS
jgi:hypothetical protein